MASSSVPIHSKLTRITLITSGVALLLTTSLFFVSELITIRQANLQQLKILSQAIASNSTAALAFQIPDDAQGVLAAFRADPHIVAAALYDNQGELFVAYPDASSAHSFPKTPDAPGYRFERSMLIGVTPVREGERQLGTLVVRSDLSAIYDRMKIYAGIAALVIALALLVAYIVARRLQRQLSLPILDLARTAQVVSDRQDYTQRAAPAGIQELDVLTSAFNHMLVRTEQSEGRLHAQVSRLALLQEITHGIGSRHDLRSIFQIVLRSLEDNLHIDFGCVCLHDSASDSVVVNTVGAASMAWCAALGLSENAAVPLTGDGLARCMNGDLVHEPDTRLLPLPFPQRFAAGGFHSLVIAPLAVETNVFGVLVAARRQEHSFSSADCEFIKQLSEHVALATHQAQLYGALQQAYDDLRQSQQAVMQQERLRALGEMASGIAHDINNAISPISLYTEFLLEKEPNLSAGARSRLLTMQRAIDDVAATIARMRDFYRPRGEAVTLAKVDINESIRQVVELTQPRWRALPQQRGIVIDTKTELAEPLPQIMGDAVELRDALTNLVFNAVDAMPEGGALTIRSSMAGSEAGTNVRIEVRDNGSGMDEETRRRCLEPFFTTKGERGTGLGLASVYGMIQRHNGQLEIDSAPGAGTTMRMIFPAIAVSGAGASEYAPSRVVMRRLRVLLVDDDPILIQSLQDALESDGHQVTTANGGQAGIDAFAAAHGSPRPFAVVVTDLGMARVDGRKVAAAIRAVSPQTPIIMLTGWGQRLLAENDVPPNVDRVLSKPPRLQLLRSTLAELVA
jgi:signal transduction histidine kinase/CheY-like chemotaxis protein